MSALSIVADQQILFAQEAFSSFGSVTLVDGRHIDQQTIAKADVLLVRSVTKVNESLLSNSPVSFIGSATSGIDHIDTDYLRQAGITFVHAPGSNARSVAEYVLSSLLVVAEQQDFSVTDKTLGIIGCGQVGSRVKRFMEALGVKCLVNDPPLFEQTSNPELVNLEQLYDADIISLHIPLTDQGKYPTRELIKQDILNKLRSDVILINTSRGEVVNEKDLLTFKQDNPKATLILDVWCNEPVVDTRLVKETFIGTPHIAGYSFDGKLKATLGLMEKLGEYVGNHHKPFNPKTEEIVISIETNENDLIHLAVMQSYDVRTDAIALSVLEQLPDNEQAEYFDGLRKNYPIRREFPCRTIKLEAASDRIQPLQQLGFKVIKI